MIKPLQSLRGIMMILIFLSHYSTIGHESPLKFGGDAGVAFFFMLSGFVLTRAYGPGTKISWRKFIFSRLRKIYPLYFIGFLCAALFFWLCGIPETIATIFMVQSFVPDKSFYFAYNGVEWFISDLMFFYALFPFLLRIVNRQCFKALYIVLVIVYVILISSCDGNNLLSWFYIFPPTRLLCFISGMMLSAHVRVFKPSDYQAVTAILAFAVTYLICNSLSWKWIYDIVWWPASALIISVFSTNEGGFITKLLSTRFLIKFGNFSFAFYIFHKMLITKLNVPIQLYLAPGYWSLPIMFLICCLVGYFVNKFIEIPLNKQLAKFNK